MSSYPGAGRHAHAHQPQQARPARRARTGRNGYDQTRYGQVPQGQNPYDQDPYDQGQYPRTQYGQVGDDRAAYDQQAGHPQAARLPFIRRRGVRAGLVATGAAAAVLVGVTACSAAQNATPVAETSSLAGAPAQQSGAPALTGLNLKVSQVPAGTVVTNDGFTVYRFDKDTSKPAKSNCDGSCAQQWPPVLASDTPWLKGVPSDKVGTVTRTDGTKQMTLGGWPLYRYAKDAAPGDTKGHGVGGTWCAVSPDGKPAKLSGAPAPAGGSSAGGSSYSSGGGSSYGSGAASQAPAPAPAAPSSGGGYGSGGGSGSGGY